jgi:hypothetical protein
MTSRKFLFELFLPEARFPDEKFWNKDGSAIHPKPKGPPVGSQGKTHADLGADAVSQAGNGDSDVYPNARSVKDENPEAYEALSDVILARPDDVTFLYDQHGTLHAQAPNDDTWYAWSPDDYGRGGAWVEAPKFNLHGGSETED